MTKEQLLSKRFLGVTTTQRGLVLRDIATSELLTLRAYASSISMSCCRIHSARCFRIANICLSIAELNMICLNIVLSVKNEILFISLKDSFELNSQSLKVNSTPMLSLVQFGNTINKNDSFVIYMQNEECMLNGVSLDTTIESLEITDMYEVFRPVSGFTVAFGLHTIVVDLYGQIFVDSSNAIVSRLEPYNVCLSRVLTG